MRAAPRAILARPGTRCAQASLKPAKSRDFPGTYTFTMRLAGDNGQQATQQFTTTIDPPLQVVSTLPAGTVGVPYSHDLIAQGGAPPYSWSVVNNISELPPGLTLGATPPDFNNVLTGTPTQAGTFSFPMEVQDSQGNMVSGTVTVTINP
jgi:large repetitive protein